MTQKSIEHDTHWGEDPRFPVDNWKAEVDNDETRLGYWEWAENQLDLLEDDDPLLSQPFTSAPADAGDNK